MPGPLAFAPPVPGLTQTNGVSPDMLSPMAMMSMMMGQNIGKEDSTTQKIETVIRLLREVGQSDPRMAAITGEALQMLVQGPSNANMSSTSPTMGASAAGVPSGGPGGAIP